MTLILSCGVLALMTHFAFLYFNPNWVLFREAENLFAQSQWERAAAIYEKINANGLDYPPASLKLAKTYFKMKNYPLAIRWYQDYLQKKPHDIWAKKEYAGALTANGNFDEAAKVYQSLLKESAQP